MRKNPTYIALLGPTRLLISEKSATYMIKWHYMIIWQVGVLAFTRIKQMGSAVKYFQSQDPEDLDGHFGYCTWSQKIHLYTAHF